MRDDLGDLALGDLLTQQALAPRGFELVRLGLEPLLELGQTSVLELGGAIQVVGALGLLDVVIDLLDLLAQRLQRAQLGLLGLPLFPECVALLGQAYALPVLFGFFSQAVAYRRVAKLIAE